MCEKLSYKHEEHNGIIVLQCSSAHVLTVSLFLQGFTLNYSRSDAIRTRTVIRRALVDVFEVRRRRNTDWNMRVVMAKEGEPAIHSRMQARRSHKARKKVETTKRPLLG